MNKYFLPLISFFIIFSFSNSYASDFDKNSKQSDDSATKQEGQKKKAFVLGKDFQKGSCAAAMAGLWFDFTFKDCLKEAASGDLDAKHILGKMYIWGWGGIKKDVDKGLNLWQQAAESGKYNIFYAIASVYSDGIHIEKDYIKAYAYYSVSAAVGNKHAAKNVKMFKKLFLRDKDDLNKAQKLAYQYISEMLPSKFHKEASDYEENIEKPTK